MNAFSGLMQAVSGLVSGFGDKTGNIGKGFHGLPVSDDTILFADDNTRSFLAWVQNFMDNAATADADGQSGLNFQPSDLDSDLHALNQLQALLADARDQFSADRQAPHPLHGESLDNGQVPLPQGIINAIIAHHERTYPAGQHSPEALTDVPEKMAAEGNMLSDGQIQAFGKDPLLQAAASGIPNPSNQADERQIKENTPAGGHTQAAGKGPLFQTAASGIANSSGHADERQMKENTPAGWHTQAAGKGPLSQTAASGVPTQAVQADEGATKESPPDWVVKEKPPEEGLEKREARSLSKPQAPASDGGQTHANRLIQERLPTGLGIAGKAADPATSHLQPIAGQTKDPDSKVTGLAGQPSASSEDDTANFQGKDKHDPAPRVELATVKEEEWQKGQSSDAVKHTGSGQTQAHPFQDTAKVLAGDPATNMAVKPTTGQAAALTRTEDSAVKTFQSTVMDQIVDKAAMRSIHGRSEIQIRLKPEFLGNVQMNIAADKEQLVVRIMTDRPVVKEIIETHLHHLKTELQNQGLAIDKFEVMVNPDANQQHSREQFAQMFKHHSSQNGRQQAQEQDPETLNRDGGNHPDDVPHNRDGINYFA